VTRDEDRRHVERARPAADEHPLARLEPQPEQSGRAPFAQIGELTGRERPPLEVQLFVIAEPCGMRVGQLGKGGHGGHSPRCAGPPLGSALEL